ncbi:MAG: ABC transporter ATP-binding protein [Methylicorpusculum sp.]|uniref:ABC transporter ATP-binding protein n=1 Tax=Methylicorpusculum sp. TaxID=2713644 RepID=UPI002718D4E9|nr:ABC transporter ATP-binding protein [Methylicorpusculum sp.]MDO8940106.1 ABC transporter ATP-binding protein [Methylicorpusculum sp.]MDP2202505.1 ABC transporter ATP-binding protein [Methylicorpusculum sp.]
MNKPVLQVNNLSVVFGRDQKVVDGVSFEIAQGETFALVGESGSGKSLTALSVLRLLPRNAKLTARSIKLGDLDLMAMAEFDLCRVRGRRIALIFQDPMSSLNPVLTIGRQIEEVLEIHQSLSANAIKSRVVELLKMVELPNPDARMGDFPHQLSGGQRQRVMIAIALAGNPELLIADEPTTALDVTIQAQILDLLKSIQKQTGMALLLISHDLALVSNRADRIAVMQQGKIVETGKSSSLFKRPTHLYTQKLMAALPLLEHSIRTDKPGSEVVCRIENFKVYYPIRKGVFKRVVDHVKAVDDVSFDIQRGKTLALVGESGCGKTTLGKALLNLIPVTAGRVLLDGIEINRLSGEVLRKKRAEVQIVFQDPFSSMNPRMLVGEIIEEGIKALRPEIDNIERQRRVFELLRQVDLPEESAHRYPHEFSGGQRQRICIARALAVEPKLIVCDEPTSALDVSVQAQIIALLKLLQQQKGISYLFITHDLALVAEIADDVAVMLGGKIVEYGRVEKVLMHPDHVYTKTLLNAVPQLQI